MSAQKQGAHAGALRKRHEKIIKPNNDNKKMKKNLFRLFALLFVASTVFTACDNDNEPENPYVPLLGIDLNKRSLTLAVGETAELTAIISARPENATNLIVFVESSDEDIASIDETGRITAHATGLALISLRAHTTAVVAPTQTLYVFVGRTVPTQGGVTINGLEWAISNVDIPGTFAENPQDFGMHFQWNRRQGWNMTDRIAEGWDRSIPTGTTWESENDPCPLGWRVPTSEELGFLYGLADKNFVSNWNNTGVNGLLLGTAPNQIFLPAVGSRCSWGTLTSLTVRIAGHYWSSTQFSDTYALLFRFDDGWPLIGLTHYFDRAHGASVRCVAKD